MAINIFAQGQKAFDHSFDQTQGFYDHATRRKAGAKLATGDRTGAATEFGNAGMITEARQMQADQFAVEDRQAKQADGQKAEAAKRAQLLIGAASALKQLPWDPNSPTPAAARRQALSHPVFEMAGLPRAELDKLTDADLSDQSLDMFVGQVKRQLEFVKGSDGTWTALDKESGEEVASGMTPQRDTYKEVDPEKDLVRIPGTEGGPAAPAAAPASAGIAGPLAELEGSGVRVTNDVRDPAKNARVGGVPNSRHLSGEAADLVPPAGMSMAQLAQEAKRRFPNARVINEGDHIHVQWGRGQSRPAGPTGPEVVRRGQPKAAGRMATPADKAALGLPADAPYWIDENGKPSAVSGEKPNKPLTEYQGKSVEYMNAALGGNERLNDLATRGIYKPRTATDSLFSREKDGTKRLVLRTDEDRQFMQAAKEWLAPILRKDTGAAVTDSELATYMDIYIPKFEDSPQVMWQKAQARDKKMRALYGANKTAYDGTFGDPGKWKVLTDPRTRPSARPAGGGRAKPSLSDIFK